MEHWPSMRKLRQSRRSNSKNLPNLPRECPKVTLKKLVQLFSLPQKILRPQRKIS